MGAAFMCGRQCAWRIFAFQQALSAPIAKLPVENSAAITSKRYRMDDRLIRDIPIIERKAAEHETENLHFRSFLKGRLNWSDGRLDAAVQETTDRVWEHIDCRQCANCCRTMQVEVDDDDIARLASHLSLTVDEFHEAYVAMAVFGEKVLKTQPCVFLDADNKCSVYDNRPAVCRDFPYLHAKDFRSRTYMMIDNTAVCPIVFNVWDELKEDLWRSRRRRSP